MDNIKAATEKFITAYKKDTNTSLKLIDVYLVYIMLSGILQFVYMSIAGTFPYNAFLAGFISSVGSFVLTVNLRIQTNTLNKDTFKTISPERLPLNIVLLPTSPSALSLYTFFVSTFWVNNVTVIGSAYITVAVYSLELRQQY